MLEMATMNQSMIDDPGGPGPGPGCRVLNRAPSAPYSYYYNSEKFVSCWEVERSIIPHGILSWATARQR